MNIKKNNLGNCRYCKSSNVTFILHSHNSHGKNVLDKNEIFEIYECNFCSALNIFNLPLDLRYYPLNYYSTPKNHITIFLEKWFKFFTTKLKEYEIRRNSTSVNKIKILDVGCGDGSFLELLNKEIFIKRGLDINENSIKLCSKKSLKCVNTDLQHYDNDNDFDVITMFHVLEHLEDPKMELMSAYKLLNNNGLLYITVPNKESLGYYLGNQYWFHLDSPRHLSIPTEVGIKKLLQSANFNIVKKYYEFYEFPLDLFWSVRSSKFRHMIYSLYPLLKVISNETKTYLCKKNKL